MDWIGVRPGIAVGHIDRRGDVHRINELVESASRSSFFGDDDGAPWRPSHRIARVQAGHDRRRIRVRWTGQIYTLYGGIGRLFVAHEKVLRMIVVGPKRDLV